ncbi:BF3164 family lipoprotein [Aureibaculum sp. 2210JD6-5]|uniref:BF3164 family lipoprotein n=1 Tax=Aureibaculum sp. 2210JD6-5 TaxID=3103957 RepID=UPI002AADC8E6|nr:BF3164 family lipoprotein [Aureibaculum sp. 2210JD6-5]MDY7396712.1 BF3164 family lipoprotein [Aureibaculum sp. 2210JD6-5]
MKKISTSDIINICLSFIALLILNRCANKFEPNKNSITFNKSYAVEVDSVEVPPVLLKERRIIATNDFLVSMNIDSDTIFRVFKLPSYAYLGSFGSKGKGPQEFVYPNISSFRTDGKNISISDLKKVFTIGLNENDITNNKVTFLENYYIPGKIMGLNQATVLNDSIICGVMWTNSTHEIVSFNTHNEEIGSFIDYPNFYPNAPKKIKPILYNKHISLSPDKSKLAILYTKFSLLRIYDFNTGKLIEKSINGTPDQKDISFTKNSIKDSFDLYKYYKDITITDKYIYGLYQLSTAQRKNKGSNEYISKSISQKELHIFTWNGEPKLKIKLEDWMNIFTVTTDDKNLIFVHPEKEDLIFTAKLNFF